MKSDKIKCENMLRIHDLKLLDKLQEIYQKSRYRSINEFLNACLKQFAVYDKSPGYTCRECKVGTKELNEIMFKDFLECKKLG